ncbi:MAG: LysR family transcriptional regulator [Lachnospiraceae bacterium]|nr:LysR family transcriptional regulator [Lachnospiraceae bacterium]
MEIRNLATFLQVAATKNFTQAGRLLGYSQSNVSMQIQQLESDVGVKLFDRIGRGVVLTQYGEELLPYARQIVAAAGQMENFLRSEAEMGGTIRVGMVESLLGECFEPLLLNYTKRFPNVKIDLVIDGTVTLQEMLLQNEIDLACLIDDPLPKSKWKNAYEKTVKVWTVVGANHPLARASKVAPSDLGKEKFILMEESAPYTMQFHQWAGAEELEIDAFLTLQNPRMAARLLESSEFVSFLPEYAVKEAVETGRLIKLDVMDCDQDVQIILHRNKVLTPQLNGFLEEATRAFELVLGDKSEE